ncbi:MAG TPA: DMT family transporter, partial [Hyphomonadaceae bacterium]|nr:DMT family transporter [Hyphomonadaceae bacterium]
MTDTSLRPGFSGVPPIVLALAGVCMGCVMDALIKHLGAAYTVILVASARYVFGTAFSGATVLVMKLKLPGTAGLRWHALRAVVIAVCSLLFFNCLTILPIAEATVLIFCAPLMIAPLARWLLGEKVRPMAGAALVIGFTGMLVTIQGAEGTADNARRVEGIVSGVAAAALYALSMVLLRRLAQRDHAVMTAFLSNAFPAIYLLPFAIALGVAPQVEDAPLFALTGLTGFAMWFLLTMAYSRAQAQNVAAAE